MNLRVIRISTKYSDFENKNEKIKNVDLKK